MTANTDPLERIAAALADIDNTLRDIASTLDSLNLRDSVARAI